MILQRFKQLLTRVGERTPGPALIELQAVVNYLGVGRWMRQHGYQVPKRLRSREEVWSAMAEPLRDRPVLYLEFGVYQGGATRFWSKLLRHPDSRLHGFDSFEGLPERGGCWSKGQFDVGGRIPVIEDRRVRFFKGWFDQVLPTYVPPPHESLVVILDADLYSSTMCVLRHLQPWIRPGTLIYFDELNHLEHEPRALDEFMSETGLVFRPAYTDISLAFTCFECLGLEPGRVPLGGALQPAEAIAASA
jgi:hypothetical protein